MNIDERLQALAESVELLTLDMRELQNVAKGLTENIHALSGTVQSLAATVRQDGENIRALARIAEIHERRLTALEPPGPTQ